MSAPNIIGLQNAIGKTKQLLLTTSTVTILSNSAASGKLFKINSILIGNIHATDPANVTVALDQGGTTLIHFNAIAVPANATMILVDRNTAMYLEEQTSIEAKASVASSLNIMINYEELR